MRIGTLFGSSIYLFDFECFIDDKCFCLGVIDVKDSHWLINCTL